MKVDKILYAPDFIDQFLELPQKIQQRAVAKEKIFRNNPLHPSLRLHTLEGKLQGLWSISITKKYRIIFKRMPNGDILFISIGKHNIYK